MKERLSAFVDNELSELEERRLLKELGVDVALRATWDRYHLIRDALHRDLEQMASADLSARIASAVSAESALPSGRKFALSAGKVAGGLAIAATVAAVALLNFPLPTAPTREATPVAATTGAPIASVAARGKSAATNALNAYLVEHNEFAPTAGMGNMLPYVRTVKHDDTPSQ